MSTSIKGRFWLWTAAMIVIAAVFVGRVLPNLHVQTDILALLPDADRDAHAKQAELAFANGASRMLVFLVGAPDFPTAQTASKRFADALQDSGAFQRVQHEISAEFLQASRELLPYRFGLLNARHRELLERGDLEPLRNAALSSLYTPLGAARPLGFREDPLGLLGEFLQGQAPADSAARLSDSVMTVADDTKTYVLVRAEAAAGAFDVEGLERAAAAIRAGTAAATGGLNDVEVIGSGVLLHSTAAAQRAQRDITVLGGISLGGVLLLLILAFRTLRVPLLTFMAMGLGALAAVTVCSLVFGQIHILTLSFGTALIGVSADYSIHFFASRLQPVEPQGRSGAPQDSADPGRSTSIAILLGALTTVAGFLGIGVAPVPGLQQIALFSAVGIAVACGCVLCMNPRLVPSLWRARLPDWTKLLSGLPTVWAFPRPFRFVIAIGLIAVVAGGLANLRFSDDIRLLQTSPPELLQNDRRVAGLLGTHFESRFILVRAADAESLLQREEALTAKLDSLVAEGAMRGYTAVSRSLPSVQRQRHDKTLLEQNVYGPAGLLPGLLRELGFSESDIDAQLQEFELARDTALTPDAWLTNPISEPFRALWLGRIGEEHFSAITLAGLTNPAAVRDAAESTPGAAFVDRVAEMSAVLGHYREVAMLLLGVTLIGFIALLALRYGFSGASRVLLPVLLAGSLTLAALGYAGMPVNLFNVLSLLLVLGMGIDYAIFLREDSDSHTLFAVVLCAATTWLSFGLLALSGTPFIRSIGLTVTFGIIAAFVSSIFFRSGAPARAAVALPRST